MQQTRIGVIGAGYIGRKHLDSLIGFDDVRIVAVADRIIDRAREQAARCGAKAYEDHERMLDAEELDALYICVPPFAHGPPEAAAVERGLPFFVEKPLALDLATADEVARGVRDRGLVTAAGYHWRYLNVVERAQEILSENPPRLALGFWLDETPPVAWWTEEARSGGQMIEQTTHVFDLARLLVGEVRSVHAVGARSARPAFPSSDVSAVSVSTLRFDSGALGTVSSTCLLSGPHRIGLHLFCEGLAVEMSREDLVVEDGKGRRVYERQGDPIAREDRDFVDAVRGGEDRIRVPYAEALRTHRLAISAARSAREGRTIELRPEADGPAAGSSHASPRTPASR